MRRAFLHTALLVAACGGGGPAATAPAAPEAPANAGSIAGTVRDASSGDPLSMAEIEVVEWTTRERATELASSQADGAYRIDGLPPGTYMIDVRYADYRLRLFAVPVEAHQTTALDLPLDTTALSSDASYDYVDVANNPVISKPPPDPTRSAIADRRSGGIRGVVRDIARSEALAGAVISALTGPTGRTRNAISDDDGRYLLRGLPPGTYTLSVYYHLVDRGNIEVRRTGVEVVAGEITEIDLNLDAKTEE